MAYSLFLGFIIGYNFFGVLGSSIFALFMRIGTTVLNSHLLSLAI